METDENKEANAEETEGSKANSPIELRHITVEPAEGTREQTNSAGFSVQNENYEQQERGISKRDQMLVVSRSFLNGVMPHLFASSSIIFIFWLLAYISFITILAFQTVQTLSEYMSHPVTVEVSLESTVTDLEFPAVALCNNNLVRKSYISRITNLRSLALLDEIASVNFRKREDQYCDEFGMFECFESEKCIPREWVCNGREECNDGDDEPYGDDCQDKDPNFNQDGGFCIQGYAPCPGEHMCAKYCDGNKECVVSPGYDESERGGCNDTCIRSHVATSEEKTLQSLNYPENYPNFLECEYEIRAPVGERIQIEFEKFEVENERTCNYDYLRIQDGQTSPPIYIKFGRREKLCGILSEIDPVVSTSDVVIVLFYTDSYVSGKGWSLKYKVYTSESPSNNRNRRTVDSYASTEGIDYNYYDQAQFHKLDRYNWYSAFHRSDMPDYSDFKNFVKFHQNELIGNGHQKSDFIVQCVFNGELCEPSDFRTVQSTLYGNCFTFNYVVDPNLNESSSEIPKKTSKTGMRHGLKLSVFLDKDEYIGILGQNSGARVTLFNSYEAPPINDQGVFVSAGTSTFFALRQEIIEREGDPYTLCTDTWPSFLELSDSYLKYEYSQDYCRHLCLMKELALKCNCTESFDSDFSRNKNIMDLARNRCDVWSETQSECVSKISDKFSSHRNSCDCPAPCKTRNLIIERSTTEWPTEPYAPYFASLMLRSSSKSIEGFIEDAINNGEVANDTNLVNLIKKNFARIEINFQDLKFTSVKQTPKYNLSTLFGTLGGNLGLWLGWSILSVFELFEWILKIVAIFAHRRQNIDP